MNMAFHHPTDIAFQCTLHVLSPQALHHRLHDRVAHVRNYDDIGR